MDERAWHAWLRTVHTMHLPPSHHHHTLAVPCPVCPVLSCRTQNYRLAHQGDIDAFRARVQQQCDKWQAHIEELQAKNALEVSDCWGWRGGGRRWGLCE